MSDLKDQVKKFVAFESVNVEKDSNDDLFQSGEKFENSRLAPLNNLWPEVVEALEKFRGVRPEMKSLKKEGEAISFDLFCPATELLVKIKKAVEGK